MAAGSTPPSPYLDVIRDRVLVYDGATGTWLQEQGLTADDFGGEDLEGCNEILVDTRPALIRRMHAEYFAAGADAVETNSFGVLRRAAGRVRPGRPHPGAQPQGRVARP